MRCPFLNVEISPDECFLTATVAEGTTPKVDGIKEIVENKEFPTKCLNCPNHPK